MATRSNVLRTVICGRHYRRRVSLRLYAAVALAATIVASAAAAQEETRADEQGRVAMVATDAKDYILAPIHARGPQWVRFGIALGAIALAHEYDDDVREHFETVTVAPGTKPDTHDGS